VAYAKFAELTDKPINSCRSRSAGFPSFNKPEPSSDDTLDHCLISWSGHIYSGEAQRLGPKVITLPRSWDSSSTKW
jgi:hypothetical protein